MCSPARLQLFEHKLSSGHVHCKGDPTVPSGEREGRQASSEDLQRELKPPGTRPSPGARSYAWQCPSDGHAVRKGPAGTGPRCPQLVRTRPRRDCGRGHGDAQLLRGCWHDASAPSGHAQKCTCTRVGGAGRPGVAAQSGTAEGSPLSSFQPRAHPAARLLLSLRSPGVPRTRLENENNRTTGPRSGTHRTRAQAGALIGLFDL